MLDKKFLKDYMEKPSYLNTIKKGNVTIKISNNPDIKIVTSFTESNISEYTNDKNETIVLIPIQPLKQNFTEINLLNYLVYKPKEKMIPIVNITIKSYSEFFDSNMNDKYKFNFYDTTIIEKELFLIFKLEFEN